MWKSSEQERNAVAECSFCGKDQDQVGRLTAGPGGVYICDECIYLCRKFIEEAAGEAIPIENLTKVCSNCGTRPPASHRYCFNCGTQFP